VNTSDRCSLVLMATVLGLSPLSAWSQTYPTKPIKVIIPFTPGGALDQIVQLVGAKLTDAWGQQVLMDHRPGAGGVVGTAGAAKAAPDGHTLLLGSIGPSSVSPSLYAKLPYDSVNDFAAITLAITYSNLLVVHPSVPANTTQQLVALAKAKPGQLTIASSGTGTSSHLAGELLKQMAGIDMLYVHYRGTIPALTDTMSGQVQALFGNVGPTLPFVKSGKLKALGVTSAKRSRAFPDLPTLAESGVPGYEVITWVGFWAPAGTPKDIIAKLNTEIVKALRNPEVQASFLTQGVETAPSTPEQADAFLKSEIAKWAKVVKAANIKLD
jgi:tripartite-type tricarboxylate transporter receptor subunit TctC